MPWLARIEQTRFSNWPQPPSPEPKSRTARAVPVGAKWYVPKGPRFRRSMIVGASGSSALSEFDMPSSRAGSQKAAIDADPQTKTREQNMRINTIEFAAPELLGVIRQKVRIAELRSPRNWQIKINCRRQFPTEQNVTFGNPIDQTLPPRHRQRTSALNLAGRTTA